MTADRKVDWDELKRPLTEIAESLEFQLKRDLDLPTRVALSANKLRIEAALAALPAILAERSAAQRLRDAAWNYRRDETIASQVALDEALAAFDKETQNEG